MARKYAHKEMDCTECYRCIGDGDPVWYLDASPHCFTCAAKKKIVCPECDGSKKPQFAVCWDCRGGSVSGSGHSGLRP